MFGSLSKLEFLKEGFAVEDFMRPGRIVISMNNTPSGLRAKEQMCKLYLADLVGGDIEAVRQGVGSDSRIGYGLLYSGTGGSCFPKDFSALSRTAKEFGRDLKILEISCGGCEWIVTVHPG